jgi:predicted N-acyltransferase
MTLPPPPPPATKVRAVASIGDVPADDWNRCANPLRPDGARSWRPRRASTINGLRREAESICEADEPIARPGAEPATDDPDLPGPQGEPESMREADESISQRESYNPFIDHAFLYALEASGSATARTGWSGAHLLAEDEAGRLRGCVPCYLKSHSRGEYVFDHAFADAYERAGGRYYPKLQVSVPFTPVSGRRLLVADGPGADGARQALIRALAGLMRQTGASSVHVTFANGSDCLALAAGGFLRREDRQFHWLDRGYRDYEDFLSVLSSRKRKALRRERREAVANGIEIVWLTGSEITEADLDAFFAFYSDTGSRKWGRPYLTRAFFSLVSEAMRERILLVMARRNGRWIAGAINFIGDDALYGRHWGCIEDHPFLHFEVCYHQAIAFALAHGLGRVEAGAQGEHKLARGYEPVVTSSAHLFADRGLHEAVADYLERERTHIGLVGDALAEALPFRRGGGD